MYLCISDPCLLLGISTFSYPTSGKDTGNLTRTFILYNIHIIDFSYDFCLLLIDFQFVSSSIMDLLISIGYRASIDEISL